MQVKKEISVAVFIGLLIGAVIIGGIYRAKSALEAHRTPTPTPLITSAKTVIANNNLLLKITSPIDNSVVTTSKLELTGATQLNTYITILTEKNEYIIVPNELGNFTQEISLVKGVNIIVVTSYTPQGDKTEKTLNLVYTAADL
ncbi:MAG: hypothetical protein WCL07_04040 [bacterium]